ncbi:MAG: DUF6390 family protein [Patescibacteria group bacterium]|nr:DUF6390 family protein [Patescibacteria group bacterium]
MDGVLRCSRYAFGPNRLHYCGPDANREVKAYIDEGVTDVGLENLLLQFKTMYPYLEFIAYANKIQDPFDNRVVGAYWLGNDLLQNIEKKHFHRHLIGNQQIKRKIKSKDFEYLEEKLKKGAVPHHSFHVLNVWRRTGNFDLEHSLESLSECVVSAGKIIEIKGPAIIVETEPIIYADRKLCFGSPIKKKLNRRLESEYDIEQIKSGDTISIHWSVPCEVISLQQAEILKKYTLQSLKLANQTI